MSKKKTTKKKAKQTIIYVVQVETEACDKYTFKYKGKKPSEEDICKRVWEAEGKCADLQFYIDTMGIEIIEVKP